MGQGGGVGEPVVARVVVAGVRGDTDVDDGGCGEVEATEVFFNKKEHTLLLINLAQYRTPPPASYLRQRFETIVLLANITWNMTHSKIKYCNTMIAVVSCFRYAIVFKYIATLYQFFR